MTYDEILKLISENLRLEVVSEHIYTGGEPLYEKQTTVQLVLFNDVISAVTL